MVEGTKEAFTRHWVRWLTLGGSVGFLALVGPSCMYDKDKPCGDDWDVDKDANGNPRCVCPAGTFYTATGCIKCGDHEILQGNVCMCEEGYAKPSPEDTCQEVVDTTTGSSTTSGAGGTGSSTSSGSTTGASGAAGAGGEGGDSSDTTTETATETATSTSSTTGSTPDCTVNDDCAATEICDAGVCRNPTGWGATCATSDDCAGFEADFCDSFQLKCTVSNCSNVPDTCPAGFDCCDLSTTPGFAIMCIPTGPYCPTPAP